MSRIVDDTSFNIEDALINALDDGTLTEEEKAVMKQNIQIVDDERMPYYFDDEGNKVYADICMNSSGAIRR